jgi:Flp pilus assembly pilin Flp
MVQILWLIRDKVLSFLKSERAQDTFEYVLIIGGISVVVIAAVALASPSMMEGVIDGVCAAITATIPAVGTLNCTP